MLEKPPEHLKFLKPGFEYIAPAADQEHFAAGGILGDESIHALVLFDRRIDTHRLNHAIRLVRDAMPVLGCRFNPSSQVWERVANLDELNIWTVHVESGLLPPEARPGVYRFVIGFRNPGDGTPLEARLFRSSTDMLCLKLHHAAADAQGLKEILYRIAEFYRRLETEPDLAPTPELGDRDVNQVLSYAAVTSQSLEAFSSQQQKSNWVFPSDTPGATSRPAYAVHKVPFIIYKNMKAYAARQQSTVEEILAAAYYRALAEILHPNNSEPLQLRIQVDLRNELPPEKQRIVGNFSKWFIVSLPWQEDESFSNFLKRIQQELSKTQSQKPWLMELAQTVAGPLPAIIQRQDAMRRRRQAEIQGEKIAPSLAHFGDLQPERLDFGEARVLDAYLLGPTQAAPRIQLNASDFGEALTLSVNYYKDAISTVQVEELLSLMVSHLSEF